MVKKGVFMVLCLMLAGVVGLFAAGGSESSAAAPVELNFLEVMTSPARTKVIQQFIQEFETQNPNITINLQSPPYEQADNKLTMMLNANQPLDIVEIRDYTVKQFVNNKKLENLEGYLAKWEHTKTLLPVTLQSARTVDNTAYLIPEFFYIKALFVRQDKVKEAGLSGTPATLDELWDMSIKMTDPAKNRFGFVLRGKNGTTPDSVFFSDIPNVNISAGYKKADGTSVFLDPTYLANIKKMVEVYQKACPKDAINWGFNEQVNAFASGVGAYLIQDPDTVALLDSQLGRENYTVIPMPLSSKGIFYQTPGFAGFGITSYSKHKDEAWKFISYFSSPEKNAEFNKQYGPLPIHSSTYASDPYFSKGVYQAWAKTMSDTEHYILYSPPLGSDKFPGWNKIYEKDMQAVLLGQMTPEAAVQKWAAYWQD